jgi:hypothetical protein
MIRDAYGGEFIADAIPVVGPTRRYRDRLTLDQVSLDVEAGRASADDAVVQEAALAGLVADAKPARTNLIADSFTSKKIPPRVMVNVTRKVHDHQCHLRSNRPDL